VLLLDELDRRLHPLLSRLFVQMALEGEEVNRRSQLLFTTHETHLLDLDLLRRDEIWFVEKDRYGASHIYSLAEFKIRPDLKVEKGYLNGRFGAIPFLADVQSLGWTEKESKAPVEV
jgi:AAA15 family ATPase/GTPase